jgi:hypothetical protein
MMKRKDAKITMLKIINVSVYMILKKALIRCIANIGNEASSTFKSRIVDLNELINEIYISQFANETGR